jgi:hypothetical protein
MIDFFDVFNPYYDQFSIHSADFVVPAHFSQYVPDNQTDYQCLTVLSPNLSRGASQWTLNNTIYGIYQSDAWITIGVYRDEGRAAARRPAKNNVQWVRSDFTVTVTDSSHKVHVGDLINVSNANVPTLTGIEVIRTDANGFDFLSQAVGPTSGATATYQMTNETNFYESHLVFRLLPSFKLIPYSLVQQIFETTAPTTTPALKTLYNVTTGKTIVVPNATNSYTNYELPNKTIPPSDSIPLLRRFSQVYDENGKPILLQYQTSGYPTPVNNVDSQYKNMQVFYNLPVDPTGDSRIFVYDFYGLDINDPIRTPYTSSTIVSRDTNVSGDLDNFKIQTDNLGDPVYTGTLNDLYGNLAIGVQSNNALVIRKQVLPLELDAFNRPVKGASA